jgi:hypothetical protein
MRWDARVRLNFYLGGLVTKLSKIQGPKRKWPLTSNDAISRCCSTSSPDWKTTDAPAITEHYHYSCNNGPECLHCQGKRMAFSGYKSQRRDRIQRGGQKKQGRVTLASHHLRIRQYLDQVSLFFSSAI